MSERRRLLSRPRTRVYDCNYNIGEKYYKPTLDRLDRKYSGRTFSDEPEESPSRRAANLLADFETKATNGRTPNRASLLLDDNDDVDEEFSSTMKRIKAARAARASSAEDDFDSFTSRKNALKKKSSNFAEKVLDSVGINNKMHRALEDDVFFKKKTFRSAEDDEGAFSKWSAVKPTAKGLMANDDSADELAAMSRARKSRARLADLESEMEELSERGLAREKRLAGLRALISENEGNNSTQEAVRVKRVVKTEKKVTF